MRSRILVSAIFVSLLAAACSNSSSEGTTTTSAAKGGDSSATQVAVTAPGVTADEIRVGGVASTTNPLGGKYGESFDGVQAYFAMVNSEGGIYGRDLTLASERDDQLSNRLTNRATTNPIEQSIVAMQIEPRVLTVWIHFEKPPISVSIDEKI